MSRKKKTQKLKKHEYVIFIVGGILAVAVAVLAAYFSAQSGDKRPEGYWIRIYTDTFIYDGFIYDTEPGRSLKKLFPYSTTAQGKLSVMSIPVDLQLTELDTVAIKGQPGDILYVPEQRQIILVGDLQKETVPAVRLGKLDDYTNFYRASPPDIPVRMETRN